jgi:5-methylcytosine-specific restriction endonuclease McrA
MKRGMLKKKSKSAEQIQQQKDDIERMWSLFRKIWKERGPYSEVSDQYLGREPLSIMFHHIWPKSKYPALKYVEENIILLTAEEHTKIENGINLNMYFGVVKDRKEQLRIKYDL